LSAGRGDRPLAGKDVHGVEAGPAFGHRLDGPVGEIHLVVGQESDRLTLEVDVELVGYDSLGNHVGQAPASQRLVTRHQADMGVRHLDVGVEIGSLRLLDSDPAVIPQLTPFLPAVLTEPTRRKASSALEEPDSTVTPHMYSSMGGQVQTRLRSPPAASSRPMGGQYLSCSSSSSG